MQRADTGVPSDSEAEDDQDNRIDVPQEYVTKNKRKRKRMASSTETMQSAVRLIEIGPRMQLQLIKIEDDLCSGKVIYHEYGEFSLVHFQVNIWMTISVLAGYSEKNCRRN